jgi:hypothetical protein
MEQTLSQAVVVSEDAHRFSYRTHGSDGDRDGAVHRDNVKNHDDLSHDDVGQAAIRGADVDPVHEADDDRREDSDDADAHDETGTGTGLL